MGQGIAGYVGSSTGGGRRSPSWPCRDNRWILFLASVKEPKRGIMDGNGYSSDDLVGVAASAGGGTHSSSHGTISGGGDARRPE